MSRVPVKRNAGGYPLAARGATPSAFERRCIPAGCVAPPSNIPDILGRRALPVGRLAVLGATMELHHGLLGAFLVPSSRLLSGQNSAGRADISAIESTPPERNSFSVATLVHGV